LTRFNGMWAFAVWDQMERALFLARDRFGVKPLYYTANADHFLFASEIKGLIASGLVPRSVNEARLLEYLVSGLTDVAEQTLFSNVFQVLPGHWLKLRAADWSLRIDRYFELKPRALEEQKASPHERLKELLSDAVSLRTISDVPVGTTLSGGLDSTTVACV